MTAPFDPFAPCARPNIVAGGHTVYVLGVGERLKIGRSQRWEQRVRELQTACATPLEVRGLLHGVASIAEQQIHRALAEYRLHSEWFLESHAVWRVLRRFGVERLPTPLVLTNAAEDAIVILSLWNHTASVHTQAARSADIAAFGAVTWKVRNPIGVIRRVLELARERPREIRELAQRWHEAQRDAGLAIATLRRHWGSLVSLLAAIGEHERRAAIVIGAMPRHVGRALDHADAARLVASLLSDGRARDAAIVGLLSELAFDHRALTALRVRDAAALDCSAPLAAALARVCGGQAPQAPALRGPQGRGLSAGAVYQICEGLGSSLTALRELGAKGAA